MILPEGGVFVTTEQLIVRFVMVVPTLLLMLWFLPIKGGGLQAGGILDVAFLWSGAVNFPILIFEIIGVLILWAVLDQYAMRSMDIWR